MKPISSTFLIILTLLLTNPLVLFAAPHEPSPAGGGWLELNPELGLVQTEAPWFPELTGALTIEAWIYVDETFTQRSPILTGRSNRPIRLHYDWITRGRKQR